MAGVTKRAGKKGWYAFWKVDRKTVYKSTGVLIEQDGKSEKQTKKEAQAMADALESLAKGNSTLDKQIDALRAAAAAGGTAAKMPSIAAYLTACPLTGSEKTQHAKRAAADKLIAFLGADAAKRLDWMSKKEAQAFIDDQCKEIATQTVKLCRAYLSTYFNKAIEDGLLAKNPFAGVKIANLGKDALQRDALTAQDVQKLLTQAPQVWRDMVLVCLNTFGQRISDIACMKWQSVDFTTGTISLQTQKTGAALSWPIMPQLYTRLRALYANREESGYVFPEMARRYTRSRGSLSVEFTALLRALGIAEEQAPAGMTGRRRSVCSKTFHGLRRFAVSDNRKAGLAPDLCRAMVGHDSEEVERAYFRASMDDKRQALQGMFGRLGMGA